MKIFTEGNLFEVARIAMAVMLQRKFQLAYWLLRFIDVRGIGCIPRR